MNSKIHPLFASLDHQSCSSDSSSTSDDDDDCCSTSSCKQESFTIWMKSLVMQTNGCTVYNESGEIVYRVDNYDKKGCNEVYLMDLNGKVLFTLRRRNLLLYRQWNGYRTDGLLKSARTQKPYFQVGKSYSSSCEINQGSCLYKLEASSGKSAFKIRNCNGGEVVAEAKRKQSSSGVLLGDDVLSLVVEPNADHSFIMALVTVYGLMNHKL